MGCIFQQKHGDSPKNREKGIAGKLKSKYWWISYRRASRTVYESSHSEKKSVAKELLKKREAQVQNNELIEIRRKPVLIDELAQDFLREVRNNAQKSVAWSERRWNKHLEPFFGGRAAEGIGSDLISQYKQKRLSEGAKNSTVNRELACLKRMFNLALAQTPPKVQRMPRFSRLEEHNVRTGFVEPEEYEKVYQHCDSLWLRGLLAVGYTFGFRKGELLSLETRQITFETTKNGERGKITLDPGSTKNDQGRVVILVESSREFALLKELVSGKAPADYVFTRENGKPVKDFRGEWKKVCAKAGLRGLLFHDLRRSAVRNLVRDGTPEVVAMKISGHKTRSVFDRYNIVSESDLEKAAQRRAEKQADVWKIVRNKESEQPAESPQEASLVLQ